MRIRPATLVDECSIQALYEEAFDSQERDEVATLATELLRGSNDNGIVSLVAENEDRVIGHVSFSPASMTGENAPLTYILAPLAVAPDFRNRGVGSLLVNKGHEILSSKKVGVSLVYGDPNYYCRFGFGCELGTSFIPPFPLSQPEGWQATKLGEFTKPAAPVPFTCVPALSKPELW